ncbi:uncharacterized protein LAESUDRAFT_750726 [Laetiporus sulphureus 93-53]|uniref:F-box domain-containing protein n=1 Tax=Laetiporus sulphureus 93-53 TaxID=1314785 RepID=A0A165DNM3_9APHY|nr:uncharacterized protein LAESUDRAFT_750726 [Laetiporus sulphureus 93-53]KZT05279.1 hypothetical protein LAESUDRAFT_750726 [Laetiporus sulphureus 93-53]
MLLGAAQLVLLATRLDAECPSARHMSLLEGVSRSYDQVASIVHTSDAISSASIATRSTTYRPAFPKYPRVPQELTNMIINNLRGDTSTLRVTSLVHRSWVQESQKNLFYSVDITRSGRMYAFFRLLRRHQHIGLYVRELRIVLPKPSRSGKFATRDRGVARRIPLHCKLVQKLELGGSWIPFTEKEFAAMGLVKQLKVDICFSNIDVLQSTLKTRNGLTGLSIRSSITTASNNMTFDLPFNNLKHLHIEAVLPPFRMDLVRPNNVLSSFLQHALPALESLRVDIFSDDDVKSLSEFLRRRGGNLTSLDLRFSLWYEGDVSALASALESCCTVNQIRVRSNRSGWLRGAVDCLGRTPVQDLTIDVLSSRLTPIATCLVLHGQPSERTFSRASKITVNLYPDSQQSETWAKSEARRFQMKWATLKSSKALYVNVITESSDDSALSLAGHRATQAGLGTRFGNVSFVRRDAMHMNLVALYYYATS